MDILGFLAGVPVLLAGGVAGGYAEAFKAARRHPNQGIQKLRRRARVVGGERQRDERQAMDEEAGDSLARLGNAAPVASRRLHFEVKRSKIKRAHCMATTKDEDGRAC